LFIPANVDLNKRRLFWFDEDGDRMDVRDHAGFITAIRVFRQELGTVIPMGLRLLWVWLDN
jgi:hypothetical protein